MKHIPAGPNEPTPADPPDLPPPWWVPPPPIRRLFKVLLLLVVVNLLAIVHMLPLPYHLLPQHWGWVPYVTPLENEVAALEREVADLEQDERNLGEAIGLALVRRSPALSKYPVEIGSEKDHFDSLVALQGEIRARRRTVREKLIDARAELAEARLKRSRGMHTNGRW